MRTFVLFWTGLFFAIVSPTAAQTYCTSASSSASFEYIKSVSVGGMTNLSGPATYSSFTTQTATGAQGAQVSFFLTPGFSSTSFPETWRIFIDFNKNGNFNDAGEQVALGMGSTTVSGSFVVPSNAVVGTTRMRVSMKYGGTPLPCEAFQYGEVEDYSFAVLQGTLPTPTPTPTITPTPSPTPSSAGGYCAASAITSQYEYIQNVTFGTINNSSTGGLYQNFTNLSTNAVSGAAIAYSLKPGFANGEYAENWKIFIDYNRNNIFGDAGEEVLSKTSTGSLALTGSIVVPAGIVPGPTRMRVVMQYGSAPAPCNSFQYGEVEDYSVNLIAGTTPPTPTPTPTSTGGYCSASASASQYEFIQQVSFGTIDNISTGGLYQNFTHLSTNAVSGAAIAYSLKPGFSSSAYSENWKVFIDYNRNGSFGDAGEQVLSRTSTSTLPLTGSIVVPDGIVPGPTRMRVVMQYGTEPTPCNTFPYGEVEDYSVNLIVGTTPPTATPTPTPTSTATPTPTPQPSNPPSSYCPAQSQATGGWSFRHLKIERTPIAEDTVSPFLNVTGLVTTVVRGGYLSLATSFNTPNYIQNAQIGGWIDLNRNLVFDGEDQAIKPQVYGLTSTLKRLVYIPPTASLGLTKLRLRVTSAATSVSPCGSSENGQIVDATINIVDGQEPNGFSTQGEAVLTAPPAFSVADAALAPQGGFFLGGALLDMHAGTQCMSVVKVTANGSRDPSFGTNGMQCVGAVADLSAGYHSSFRRIQKVLVNAAGQPFVLTSGWDSAYRVTKLNTNGSFDTTFNGSGTASLPYTNLGADMALLPDGRVLVVVNTFSGAVLYRLTPQGGFDPTFGLNGSTPVPLMSQYAQDIAIGYQPAASNQPARIAIGFAANGSNKVQVVGLTTQGQLDPTFGVNGLATAQLPNGTLRRMYVTLKGLVLVGEGYDATNGGHIHVTRFKTDGLLDPYFGSNGIVRIPGYIVAGSFYSQSLDRLAVTFFPEQGLGIKVARVDLETGTLFGAPVHIPAIDTNSTAIALPESPNLFVIGDVGARTLISAQPGL